MDYKEAIVKMVGEISDEHILEQIFGYVRIKHLKDQDKKKEEQS